MPGTGRAGALSKTTTSAYLSGTAAWRERTGLPVSGPRLRQQFRLEHGVKFGVVRRVPDHRMRLVEEEHPGHAHVLADLQGRSLLPGSFDRGQRQRAGGAAWVREFDHDVIPLRVLEDDVLLPSARQ